MKLFDIIVLEKGGKNQNMTPNNLANFFNLVNINVDNMGTERLFPV